MLKSLQIKNFTVFSEAYIELSPGLNIVIGENNTGKSHLLKLAYVIASIWYEAAAENEKTPGKITSGGRAIISVSCKRDVGFIKISF